MKTTNIFLFAITSSTFVFANPVLAQECMGCGESAYGPNDQFYRNDTYRQRQIQSDQPVINPVLPPGTVYRPVDPTAQYNQNPYNYQDNPNYRRPQTETICFTNTQGQFECRSL